MTGNITDDLCKICDGRIECAPTAILLISLVHTLYGHIGPEPDYFGKNRYNLLKTEEKLGEVPKFKAYYRGNQEKGYSYQEKVHEDEYDFIVVGGGTAGCVVASRLSENRKWKVLLLEAGPEEPKMALIPGLTSEFRGSSLDWQYTMRPKKGSIFQVLSKPLPDWLRSRPGSGARRHLLHQRHGLHERQPC